MLQDGHVVFVVEVLVIIQCSVLVVRSWYTRNVVVKRVANLNKIQEVTPNKALNG